ncbi:MAG: 50S ribosomal protein L7/L12 [Dehalococcoidia bacterium]|nr:50S ribosomal protein L7/L12 [Dehalococcoidia bacterium]
MTKDEILEAIKQMSVIDLADLVKSLESEFGITAAAPVAVAAAPAAAAPGGSAGDGSSADQDDEKTEFAVVLQDVGANKINVIKAVREVTTLGLREAKELVEAAPSRVKEAIAQDEANKVKEALEAAGAKVAVE